MDARFSPQKSSPTESVQDHFDLIYYHAFVEIRRLACQSRLGQLDAVFAMRCAGELADMLHSLPQDRRTGVHDDMVWFAGEIAEFCYRYKNILGTNFSPLAQNLVKAVQDG
ncbi:hypothetical protein [Paraburkholderia tropica]|uniref:hypothetical protein n=1 Tax=Paraburkholderia tropica TaxID=92647 RepID=UPI002AB6B7BE|nr:hypothetical protein [Paraburkholderia tropica]